MPELAEIHIYAAYINKNCSDQVFKSVTFDPGFTKHPRFILPSQYKLSAKARGKELLITCTAADGIDMQVTICFNHGLVGGWQWTPSSLLPKDARLMFNTSTHSLCFVDTMKMGGWKLGSWSSNRGPDPIDEHPRFCKNILDNIHKPAFSKQLCEVLLDQQYFNGIGNYLRAEIMYRTGVSPFMKARELFKSTPKNFDFKNINETSDRGLILLYLCKKIPEEVISQDLNKYGTPEQKERFHQWLRVYEKGVQVRINNRAVYYHSSQVMGVAKPDLGLSQTSSTAPSLTTSVPTTEHKTLFKLTQQDTNTFAPSPPLTNIDVNVQAQLPASYARLFGKPPEQLKQMVESLKAPSTKECTCSEIASNASLPPMSKLLAIITSLHRRGVITANLKNKLKRLVLDDDPEMFAALDAFQREPDEKELIDTLVRISFVDELRQRSKLFFGSAQPINVGPAQPTNIFVPTQTQTATSFAPAAGGGQGSDLQLDKLITNREWFEALAPIIEAQPGVQRYLGVNREKTFPRRELTFASLNRTNPGDIEVLIFGQDPYPREESAIGIAFNDGMIKRWTDNLSPSFRNIIKNVAIGAGKLTTKSNIDDLRRLLQTENICEPPEWFDRVIQQGCCWLNTSLTFTSTDQKDLERHLNFWKPVISAILTTIVKAKSKILAAGGKTALVVVLWGKHAKNLRKVLDAANAQCSPKVNIAYVEANHPAIESFHNVLTFEQINARLKEFGLEPIDFLPKKQ